MTPIEAAKALLTASLTDEDGNSVAATALPGMTPSEIEAFAAELPGPLPDDVRELLRHARGIDGPLDRILFTGNQDFEMRELMPHGVPIAGDGYGNFWVLDLNEDPVFGPVYFMSHDPAVLVYQSPDLATFLSEIREWYRPPYDRPIEEWVYCVWEADSPGVTPEHEHVFTWFGETLGPEWTVLDMRYARPGDGFAWDRFGSKTELRTDDAARVYAYRRVPAKEKGGLLRRLLGR